MLNMMKKKRDVTKGFGGMGDVSSMVLIMKQNMQATED